MAAIKSKADIFIAKNGSRVQFSIRSDPFDHVSERGLNDIWCAHCHNWCRSVKYRAINVASWRPLRGTIYRLLNLLFFCYRKRSASNDACIRLIITSEHLWLFLTVIRIINLLPHFNDFTIVTVAIAENIRTRILEINIFSFLNIWIITIPILTAVIYHIRSVVTTWARTRM